MPLEWVHDKPLTVSQVLDNLERLKLMASVQSWRYAALSKKAKKG
jgi:hypothetical protein